jgi:serine/threonine protein kinase
MKKLGQGAFGMVVLAKGRLPGGPEELYAIKAVQKQHITNPRSIAQAIAEKEALIRTSGHPYITTLHSCFQNEVRLYF